MLELVMKSSAEKWVLVLFWPQFIYICFLLNCFSFFLFWGRGGEEVKVNIAR